MSKYETQQPYIASYMIIRQSSKIAFVLRSNTKWMNGWYSLPAGKVEQGECFSGAAIREVFEEVGVKVKENDMKHILTVHRYEKDSYAKEWVDVYFEVQKYSGKAHNAEPHMHSELAWLDPDPDNLPDNVLPNVAHALEQINNGRFYAEYGWS